jgi:hypothetical protein
MRFIASSTIQKLRLENKVPILRFHLKLLDFLELPRVEYPFNTYVREGNAVGNLLKLRIEKSLSTVEQPGNTVLSPPAKCCK